MSVSAIFGTKVAVMPRTLSPVTMAPVPKLVSGNGSVKLVIECSSRPQKKATAHHKKTRPRKTQPWDIRRGPTVYPPLPNLPPEWSLVSDDQGPVVSSEATDLSSSE